MMYSASSLRKSIRLALQVSAGTAMVATAAGAMAQEQDESAQRVERIQVTGSRIQRTDMEGALPVTVIDRNAIDMSGENSVADVIRNTAFNSAGSFRPQSGSSAQGTSQVDMRGLGSNRTLILVDGRRLTMSPSLGSAQDLNSIPMAAVERIEILSDGASAIYGSDAIGGVINVITRRDYNGIEVTLGYGEVSLPNEGGDRENGSVVFGSSNSTTSVIGGVSWNRREIIYDNAYAWNDDLVGNGSTYGNNFTPAVNSGHWGNKRDDDGNETDVAVAPPIMAVPGGCNSEYGLPYDQGFLDPEDGYTNSDFVSVPRCNYNTRAVQASEASTSNESIFVKVQHDLNPDWRIYSNANFAKTSSFGRYAPTLDLNKGYGDDDYLVTPADSYNNPTNPNAWMYDQANNPDAVAFDDTLVGPNVPVYLYHRFEGVGTRDTTVDNENIDFLIGAEGYIGDYVVDFGARRVRNKSTEIGSGYLAVENAWNRVNDFDPYAGTGYNIQDPSWNSDATWDALRATTARISTFDINELFASTSFDVIDLPAGMIQGAVGVEYRDEVFTDMYDAQSEAGLIGGSAGNSAGGSRDVFAAYGEFVVPVTYDLHVTLAGRFDDYSDYGSDFSPKVGVEYTPIEGLMIRGSYGLGFRAPSLDILSMETSYSADSVRDAASCSILVGDPELPCQVDAYRLANSELDSEESTQMAFGVVYQPTDWLNFSVDYFNIEIENRIAFLGSTTLLERERAGDFIPEGLGVIREDAGNMDSRIVQIDTGYDNDGTLETSGLDFNVQTSFDFGQYGMLSQNLQLAHVLEYKVDGGRNQVGDPSRPENRLTLSNMYTYGNFDASWNVSVIEGVAETVRGGEQVGHVGTWTTHDLQVAYNTAWDGRVTFGMQNAFEKTPQLIPYGGNDYNFNLYHAYGRHTYVRYTQRF